MASRWTILRIVLFTVLCGVGAGCPDFYREEANEIADGIITRTQEETFGRSDPIDIETPADILRRRLMLDQNLLYTPGAGLSDADLKPIAHWPEEGFPRLVEGEGKSAVASVPKTGALTLNLVQCLQIAARNKRDYLDAKDEVFQSALFLDLVGVEFRGTAAGLADSVFTNDLSASPHVRGWENSLDLGWEQTLKSGMAYSLNFGVDLVKLLTMDRSSVYGLTMDGSVTMPLLRGAGEYVVTEGLTQSQRDVVYALRSLVRIRRQMAVDIADGYLGVLNRADIVANNETNYRNLIVSTRQARRLAEAGRLTQIQVDQSMQQELQSRERWIISRQAHEQALDTFKVLMGLPADARIELDTEEMGKLEAVAEGYLAATADQPRPWENKSAIEPKNIKSLKLDPPDRTDGGPYELEPHAAVAIALKHREDLKVSLGVVYDAQRNVTVAANALEAGLTLAGDASYGQGRGLRSAGAGNGRLEMDKGVYTAGLFLDIPLERTAERNAYRNSYILLSQSVRTVQKKEDAIKVEIRTGLRSLISLRESFRIQDRAVALAVRRVHSTRLSLDAGRAEMRDLLEAQRALVTAQNARSTALVAYRVAELQLQCDMGVLEVSPKGIWTEYTPNVKE